MPHEHLPATSGLTSLEYWTSVSRLVDDGLVDAGRERIIAVAAMRFPENPVFVRGRSAGVRRVLVIGASPAAQSRARSDRELKEIRRAAAVTGIQVDYSPAATVTDLASILEVRPDVLHLVCHGDGDSLLFESRWPGR